MINEEILFSLIQNADIDSLLIAQDLAIELGCGVPLLRYEINQLDSTIYNRAYHEHYFYYSIVDGANTGNGSLTGRRETRWAYSGIRHFGYAEGRRSNKGYISR